MSIKAEVDEIFRKKLEKNANPYFVFDLIVYRLFQITCLYGRIMRRVNYWTGINVGPKPGEYPEVSSKGK